MSVRTWTVVHFDNDNTVEAVPSTWISGEEKKGFMCYWPPDDILNLALKKCFPPQKNWPALKCSTFKNGTSGMYFFHSLNFVMVT